MSPEWNHRGLFSLSLSMYIYILNYNYLFLYVLGLCCSSWGLLFIVVQGLLLVVSPLVAEHVL